MTNMHAQMRIARQGIVLPRREGRKEVGIRRREAAQLVIF